MNHCPNEILLHIFEFSCGDDGSTGRVLSLVSRRFQHLASECMYQSMGVVGLTRIKKFASILEGLPEYKRRVRHLFVSSISQNTTDGLERLPDEIHNYKEISDAFTRLLQLTAHSLISCRIVSHLSRSVTLIPVSCPQLRDLTLEGPFPTLPFVSRAPYLPSLRALSFSSFTDHASSLFNDIATQAPHLTTISFYPAQACRNLANDLATALAIPAGPPRFPELGFPGLRPILPPSVKEVIIQPGPVVDPAARNAYCLRSVQELMGRKLLYMQKHDKSRRLKCVAPGPAPLASNALVSWLQSNNRSTSIASLPCCTS